MTPIAAFLLGGGQGMAPNLCAYLDPGSGSMLFQIVIAGLLSAMYCGRSCFSYVKGFLSGHQGEG
jgi:hypothetical protein